jgi:hypothetical protein
MPKKKHTSLYEEVVAITADYLGPSAERFIERQIRNHLNKSPSRLVKKDLEKLLKWSRSSLALITNDKKSLIEFSDRISLLNGHESTK